MIEDYRFNERDRHVETLKHQLSNRNEILATKTFFTAEIRPVHTLTRSGILEGLLHNISFSFVWLSSLPFPLAVDKRKS